MALAQAPLVRVRCPRCGGPMYSGYYQRDGAEYSCLLCGEYVFRPAPRTFVTQDKHQAAKPSPPAGGRERAH